MTATKKAVIKTTKTAAKRPAKKVTVDEMWAILAETQKKLDKSALQHTENEEIQRRIEKTLDAFIARTDRTIKDAQYNIGGISRSLGSIVERILTPDLPNQFKKFGFNFTRVIEVKWTRDGHAYTQIDGLLENGDQAMAVEVKATLHSSDVDEHLERMEKIRKYADERGDKREYYASMAAMKIDGEATKRYLLSKGVFLIEPAGEDVKITKPTVKPAVW